MRPEEIPVAAVVVILALAGLVLVLVTYAVATARARSHARSALASTEARFRTFFEHSPIGATVIDPDGRLLSVNDAFCRFLGRSMEELMALSASDITAPEDLEATNDFHRRLVAGERDSWEMEKRYVRGDGRTVWGHLYTTLARNPDGTPLFFLTHVADIDEARRAASELRATQTRFMTLLEMIPLPLAYVAADGRVSFMNERFVQVFGYTASEVLTIADWWRLAYPDATYRQWALGRWNEALGKSSLIHSSIPYRMTCRDGRERLVEVSAIALQDELLAAFVDVTERTQAEEKSRQLVANLDQSRRVLLSVIEDQKQAESALSELNATLERRVLERTAELSAANQELDSFAYAVSHDLRAPLRAMSGFSVAIIEDFGDALPAEAMAYLDQIRKASQNMAQLVEGLLVLSRSTRGELARTSVDLSALAERICYEMRQVDPAASIRWQIEPGLTAWGDQRMIDVVMRNLLGNAWKYASRNTSPLVRVYAELRDGTRFCCVSDNGVGFDMRHAGRLFKPFQRLHRQDEFPGIGIGLATVHRVIHRHGGTIEAEGVVGQGATFRFHLPESVTSTVEA